MADRQATKSTNTPIPINIRSHQDIAIRPQKSLAAIQFELRHRWTFPVQGQIHIVEYINKDSPNLHIIEDLKQQDLPPKLGIKPNALRSWPLPSSSSISRVRRC